MSKQPEFEPYDVDDCEGRNASRKMVVAGVIAFWTIIVLIVLDGCCPT